MGILFGGFSFRFSPECPDFLKEFSWADLTERSDLQGNSVVNQAVSDLFPYFCDVHVHNTFSTARSIPIGSSTLNVITCARFVIKFLQKLQSFLF